MEKGVQVGTGEQAGEAVIRRQWRRRMTVTKPNVECHLSLSLGMT